MSEQTRNRGSTTNVVSHYFLIQQALFVLFFIVFAAFFIYIYYEVFGHKEYLFYDHDNNTIWMNALYFYWGVVAILYFIYKWLQYFTLSIQGFLSFRYSTLFGIFLLQLYLWIITFANLVNTPESIRIPQSDTFVIFFHILFYLFFVSVGFLITYSFWKKILSFLPSFSKTSVFFQRSISLGIGLFALTNFLFALSLVSLYNAFGILTLFIFMAWLSRQEIKHILVYLISHKITLSPYGEKRTLFSPAQKQTSTTGITSFFMALFLAEFAFLIINFLIGVNLINVLRPMPIGWDDMGVYMNYGNLIAQAEKMLPLAGMLPWFLVTAIGYVFDSPTLAFYINNIASFGSVFVMIWIAYDIFSHNKNIKHEEFFYIPMTLAMMFLSMPMVIFQQAKDMKQDVWLFFISMIAIHVFVHMIQTYKQEKKHIDENIEHKQFSLKDFFIHWEGMYLVLLGLLVGYTFSIKATSFLLFSWILASMFYMFWWLLGFFSFFLLFISFFTATWLWSFLNVVYPADNVQGRMIFSIVTGIMGILGLLYSSKNILFLKKILLYSSIYIVSFLIALVPWVGYNLSYIKEYSIQTILFWQYTGFAPDYEKIYSKETLDAIKKKYETQAMSASWTLQHEDYGRYFWYETGINNYVKLPYNLTFQVNQWWEYTEITYWYFLLLPFFVLFFPYKRPIWSFGMFVWVMFFFLFSLLATSNFANRIPIEFLKNFLENIKPFYTDITDFLSNIYLPWGYIHFFLLFLIPFLLWIQGIKKNSTFMYSIEILSVFLFWYILFWSISSFWVVWYGIAMYGVFLLIIGIGMYFLQKSEDTLWIEEIENEFLYRIIKIFSFLLIFVVIHIYTIFSTIPRALSNTREAWYIDFKTMQEKQYTQIFHSQPPYFAIIKTLNIHPEKESLFLSNHIQAIKNDFIVYIMQKLQVSNLQTYQQVLFDMYTLKQAVFHELYKQYLKEKSQNTQLSLDYEYSRFKKDVQNALEKLYKEVLYPKKEYQNTYFIYRVGTFLRYFVHDNYNRMWDDSLMFEFDRYIYNENTDITIDRMKALGVKYLLIDLNGPTIDRDPRKDLTRRYEQVLKTFVSEKLKLIETDSMCLKIALEDYKKSQKTKEDMDRYMLFAWVNYESYDATGKLLYYRREKQFKCYDYIIELILKNKIDQNNYPYLQGLKSAVERIIQTQKEQWKNQGLSEEEIKRNIEYQLFMLFSQVITHGWLALFEIQ